MKEISLTRGKVALVDDADYIYLNQWTWQATRGRSAVWYATRTDCANERKTVSMHSLLLITSGNFRADHKNGNGLDNRKENLRPATRQQNGHNQKLSVRNTSGFKGAAWYARHRVWTAQIRVSGRLLHLGRFRRLLDAATAYDMAAQVYFGEFARLNFSYDPACYI